ncbi:Bromodomain-containing protein 1 [Wickerhamiella sorbophila]|uniref:Bromodomain-containing protein 1 n=1 Tax=Wickerhamiella sorbophila TaxID=45607 RepID=A0A2T0FLL0_9ASCO|nr:Bromodomain-containing protein 1 [Wickerhamiella sorbophila]PRT55874.1 Bromodomain-containing protein 1 [Wickerhamiella sorbophila]
MAEVELKTILFAQCVTREAQKHNHGGRPDMKRVMKRLRNHPLSVGIHLSSQEAAQLYSKIFPRRPSVAVLESATADLVKEYIKTEVNKLEQDLEEGAGPLNQRFGRIHKAVESRSDEPENAHEKKVRHEAVKRFQGRAFPLLDDFMSWRSSSFFAQPVTESEYYEVVKAPTDLKTIKAQVKDGTITSGAELEREIQRMFANSVMYNPWNSSMSEWTREMQQEAELRLAMFREFDEDRR